MPQCTPARCGLRPSRRRLKSGLRLEAPLGARHTGRVSGIVPTTVCAYTLRRNPHVRFEEAQRQATDTHVLQVFRPRTNALPPSASLKSARSLVVYPTTEGFYLFAVKVSKQAEGVHFIFSLLPLMEERQWTDMNTTRSKSRGGSARSRAAPLCNRRLYVARCPLSGVLIIACLRCARACFEEWRKTRHLEGLGVELKPVYESNQEIDGSRSGGKNANVDGWMGAYLLDLFMAVLPRMIRSYTP